MRCQCPQAKNLIEENTLSQVLPEDYGFNNYVNPSMAIANIEN